MLLSRPRLLLLAALLAALAAGVALRRDSLPGAATSPAFYSNILREDYVGPEACASCHEEKYQMWRGHPHSNMNQPATDASVKGDFSGASVDYCGKTFVFAKAGPDFTIEQRAGGKRERLYRMLLTVGSIFSQMYIGVQTFGPEPPGDAIYRTPLKMPFGYWMQLGRWLPVAYFDSYFVPEFDAQGKLRHSTLMPEKYMPWQNNCAHCHNTYPYELALLAGGARDGFPRKEMWLKGSVRDRASFERLRDGYLTRAELVTTGISCESCHFGGREHAINQRPIQFLPSGQYLDFPGATPERIKNARKEPYVINSICAQCHSANVPKFASGASTINSREARDLQAGYCVTKLKCTDCHNPHEALPPPPKRDVQARFDEMAKRCVSCHPAYADPAAQARHAHHPVKAGVNCLDCHMPRMSQGLDLVVHSHRISQPVETSMIGAGHPNACNLCHLDRGIGWTLDQLEKLWGRKLPRDPAWCARWGAQLEKPAGEVWAAHTESVVRLVAADACSRERAPGRSLAGVLRVLEDPNAVNRVFGLFALQHLLGRKLTRVEYDPMHPSRAGLRGIERAVQVEGRADQRQMGEGLRKVAQ